jgi:hypothetical protein
MDSTAASTGTAAVREDRAGDRTAELLAEAASRLSAHTSALNSVALRLLALEGCLAAVPAAASGARAPEKASWRASLPAESSSKTLAAVPKIRLLAIHGVEGNQGMEELALLASFTRLAGAHAVFAFGARDGRAAVNLAANCDPGGMVFTLDLPNEPEDAALLPLDERDSAREHKSDPRRCYQGTPFEPCIVRLRGNSAAFDFGRFYGAMDFVFIDGCDRYDRVMNDTQTALRLLRGGQGFIAWRGYTGGRDGVVRALEELHATIPKLAGMRYVERTAVVYARVE